MKQTTVQEVKQRLDAGEQLNIIDVREGDEFQQDNIGAVIMPLSQLKNYEADGIEDLMNEEVILHCQSGKRSVEAALILEQMGFSNVATMKGGIEAWREAFGKENIV